MSRQILEGDCVEQMRQLDEASVDAVVTDPPYGLEFMGKEWDRLGDVGQASHQGFDTEGNFKGFKLASYNASANVKCRRCRKWKWDHEGRKCECEPYGDFPNLRAAQSQTMQAWHHAWATEALRVLKPGGHLLAFGGTRTYHRLACAVEDAGFEIRDSVIWLYGSGFPKSLDVSKAIDRAAGAEREVVGKRKKLESYGPNDVYGDGPDHGGEMSLTVPATSEAEKWNGWGTALKPGHEPIVVARKPLVGTVAQNVQAHGVGALNVDGCRVESDAPIQSAAGNVDFRPGAADLEDEYEHGTGREYRNGGRWPANVVLDEEAAVELDRQSGELTSGRLDESSITAENQIYGARPKGDSGVWEPNTGGASRFFYCAKASRAERNEGLGGFEERLPDNAVDRASQRIGDEDAPGRGSLTKPMANVHPTVKPVALMRWLCRLVTPPNGLILDPFTGSGTTGIAAVLEDFRFIGIEREAEYVEIAKARIDWWAKQPKQLTLEAA